MSNIYVILVSIGPMAWPLLEKEPEAAIHRYEVSESQEVSNAVVEAFEAAGVEEFDNESVLHDYVDPDAIDMLFRDPSGNPQLVLRLWDHLVHLKPGCVAIYPKSQ